MYIGISQNTGNKYNTNNTFVMEDAVGIGKSVVAVADGHGSRGGEGGRKTADLAVYNACLGKKIKQIQKIILNYKTTDTKNAGCTLTIGHLLDNNKIHLKQIGDSSILLYSNANIYGWIIPPHNKTNRNEMNRLKNEGISFTKMGFKINDRCINVSRAIGHDDLEYMPDEAILQLEQDEMCIIATDGLWDYTTNSKILETLNNEKCPECAANKLMQNRIRKPKMDNATIVILSKHPCCTNCNSVKLEKPGFFSSFFRRK